MMYRRERSPTQRRFQGRVNERSSRDFALLKADITAGHMPPWNVTEFGHHGKMLFMESASVRARSATWKAGSGGALELCIIITVS
jgi:hypothetical protein